MNAITEGDRGSTRLPVIKELSREQTSTVITTVTLEVPARRAMPPNLKKRRKTIFHKLYSAKLSVRHFGTSANVSYGQLALVPKCPWSKVSHVRSVVRSVLGSNCLYSFISTCICAGSRMNRLKVTVRIYRTTVLSCLIILLLYRSYYVTVFRQCRVRWLLTFSSKSLLAPYLNANSFFDFLAGIATIPSDAFRLISISLKRKISQFFCK